MRKDIFKKWSTTLFTLALHTGPYFSKVNNKFARTLHWLVNPLNRKLVNPNTVSIDLPSIKNLTCVYLRLLVGSSAEDCKIEITYLRSIQKSYHPTVPPRAWWPHPLHAAAAGFYSAKSGETSMLCYVLMHRELELFSIYSILRQWCPRERPVGKTPKGVYRGLRGLSKVFLPGKTPQTPVNPPRGVFPWDIIDGVYCSFLWLM